MINHQILKYIFTSPISERVNIEGYNFLTIVTDGAFNPNLNSPDSDFSEFKLTTDRNEVVFVNGEIFNIDISERHFLDVVYQKRDGVLDGGFGNIFFYFSNKPFDSKITKKITSIGINVGTVYYGAANIVWLGNHNVSPFNYFIPYIPPHKYFHYTLDVNSNVSCELRGYDKDSGISTNAITLDNSGDPDTEFISYNAYYLTFTSASGDHTNQKIYVSFIL
jgi:hypothetical protein